jgi:hypothetical protein
MVLRKRAERRAAERAAEKLAEQRVKLFFASDGGSIDRPLVLESASLVEPRALAQPCPRCGGPLRLLSHDAVAKGASLLRAARTRCGLCASEWTSWFLVERRLPH